MRLNDFRDKWIDGLTSEEELEMDKDLRSLLDSVCKKQRELCAKQLIPGFIGGSNRKHIEDAPKPNFEL